MNDSEIFGLADASPLRTYDWPHRGPAPRGYARGMAVAFARAYAMLKRADESAAEEADNPLGGAAGDVRAWQAGKRAIAAAVADPVGDGDHDILAWYEAELAAAGAATAGAGDKLVASFAVMM